MKTANELRTGLKQDITDYLKSVGFEVTETNEVSIKDFDTYYEKFYIPQIISVWRTNTKINDCSIFKQSEEELVEKALENLKNVNVLPEDLTVEEVAKSGIREYIRYSKEAEEDMKGLMKRLSDVLSGVSIISLIEVIDQMSENEISVM